MVAVHCTQFNNEDLASFYKQWTMHVVVVEARWGDFMPSNLPSMADKDNKKKNTKPVCSFKASARTMKYCSAVKELNNQILGRQYNYPKLVDEEVSGLSYHMDHSIKGCFKTPSEDDSPNTTSSVQVNKI